MAVLALKTHPIIALWGRVRHSAMLYGILATGIRAGANILLLPLVLKVLTPSELALWWVFLTLSLIANFADFGFGQVVTRIYSFLWAGADDFDVEGLRSPPENRQPNLVGIRKFHAAVNRLYLWIACIGMVLLVVAGTPFLIRPIAEVANSSLAWTSWALFVLVVGISLSTSQWGLACQGINQVKPLQTSNLISGLMYVLVAAALLLMGWGLLAMVAAIGLRALIGRQLCRCAYLAAVGEDRVPLDKEELRRVMRRIWPNARKFGGIMIAGFLVYHANVLICSHYLGPEATASYGLTVQIGNFIIACSGLWLAVKWPQITILRTQGQLEEMAVLFARRLTLTIATFVALAVLFVIFGNMLLEWKGTQTRFLDTPLLLLYLLHIGQQHFYVQFGSLAFTENVVPFVKLSLWTGVALIALSVVLVHYMGMWGLLLAPLISTVAASTWYITRRGFQGQPLKVRQFLRAAVFAHV